MPLTLGAIADDFTGALDLANNLAQAGLRVAQLSGVPDQANLSEEIDAVVIALKTRTVPADQAVVETRATLRWLRDRGVTKYYVKYCSTFDSTPTGNIGPVIDVAMAELDVPVTIAAPAFPAAGRTVYQGYLFVNGVPLDESSMRNHPLTPMTDANVVRLLTPQTRHHVALISHDDISDGASSVRTRLDDLHSRGGGIAVVDTLHDADLAVLAKSVADHVLVTGGSGLAAHLPTAWGLASVRPSDPALLPQPRGTRAIVAGSVSHATNEQVRRYTGPKFQLNPHRLLHGENLTEEVLDWAKPLLADGATPLVYSTASPESVADAQRQQGGTVVGALVESALAAISRRLVEAGVRQLIVAGGETSGACVQALELHALHIGPQIDPGVPWAYGDSFSGGMHIALKSGNFGRPDFFTTAFKVIDGTR